MVNVPQMLGIFKLYKHNNRVNLKRMKTFYCLESHIQKAVLQIQTQTNFISGRSNRIFRGTL